MEGLKNIMEDAVEYQLNKSRPRCLRYVLAKTASWT